MFSLRSIVVPTCMALSLGTLAGCDSAARMDVPSDAQSITTGQQMVSYKADGPGMVYVVDTNNNSIAYAGQLNASQALLVDPQNNRVTIDGMPVSTQTLRNGDNYKIMFKSGMETKTEVNVSKTTVEKSSTSGTGGGSSY